MASDGGSEKPESSRPRTRSWLAGLVGGLVFLGCFTLCLIGTNTVAEYAVRDMPRDEAYNALARDGTLVGWCCGGSVLSLAISALAGLVTARLIRG
jgi:hypothetical protein